MFSSEPLPVQDIDSRTIYNNVFLYWNGTHGYTYNVSIPELDIFNRSTDIEEISFNLKDEGIQANTSYTVVVESIVCGTPGNASSAVITIAMGEACRKQPPSIFFTSLAFLLV